MKQLPRTLVTLLCILFSLHLLAQERLELRAKINFLSIFDPNYPTIQPGVELWYRYFSVVYKHGFPAPYIFHRPGTDGSYNIGYKDKYEFHYYPDRNSEDS